MGSPHCFFCWKLRVVTLLRVAEIGGDEAALDTVPSSFGLGRGRAIVLGRRTQVPCFESLGTVSEVGCYLASTSHDVRLAIPVQMDPGTISIMLGKGYPGK